MKNKLSCAICQPHYLPWIGYFEMIDRVDVFVFLDDVQFIKREWKNRNKIRKVATGNEAKWLTVPIAKDSRNFMMKDARISTDWDWVNEHCHSLKAVYRYTEYFDRYFKDIKKILTEFQKTALGDLNVNLLTYFCRQLGIITKLVKSSDIGVSGKREEKLLNVCKALGADFYLANNATGEYVGESYFRSSDIKFEVQNYKHPRYVQRHKEHILPFMPYLSVVDLLFNCGEESLKTIIKGRPEGCYA